ncbi:MAG TPA: hypothetical protein VN881_06695 [Candidatus Acidoferrales bacterium]|nr:hypothetical protein [Candidatus Acidoferrales bacterium]
MAWLVLSPVRIECGLRYLGAEHSLVYLRLRYEAFHVLDGLQRYSSQPQMVDWMGKISDERQRR